MKYLISTTIAVPFLCAIASADVLTLFPVADSFVDALDPDTAFPTGHLEAAMTGDSGTLATDLTFLYAQYQLPEGMTGQDIASINSVDFRVRRASEATPKLNTTYYVYAVFDGVDTENADTYTWNDGVGYDETHNEVRFLTPDEISYYSDPAESAFIGSLDTTSSGPTTRPFGFVADHFQSATALENRRDAVLQDTDGRITFYMRSRANFAVTPLQMFASLENPDLIEAPVLVIDFVPGGGPVPGDYNGNDVVDAADYSIWRDTLGSTTDLSANGDDTGASMGVIDQADYDFWKANFGNTSGAGASLVGAAVPEPMSITMLLVITLPLLGTIHGRKSRVRRASAKSRLRYRG